MEPPVLDARNCASEKNAFLLQNKDGAAYTSGDNVVVVSGRQRSISGGSRQAL